MFVFLYQVAATAVATVVLLYFARFGLAVVIAGIGAIRRGVLGT